MTEEREVEIEVWCSSAVGEAFEAGAESLGMSQGEYLATLLNAQDHPTTAPTNGGIDWAQILAALDYTDSELEEIRTALEHEYNTLPQLLKTGLLATARRAISYGSDVSSNMRAKGAGYRKVADAVAMIMAANEAVHAKGGTQLDRHYVSKMLARRVSGAHQLSVDQYFKQHAGAIDAHNQGNGFGSDAAGQLHARRHADHVRRVGTQSTCLCAPKKVEEQ